LINAWCNVDIYNRHTGNLLTAAEPLTRAALARIVEVLARAFGLSGDFEIDDALTRLEGMGRIFRSCASAGWR